MKANQSALQPITFEVHLRDCFSYVKIYFIFHIIPEEPSQRGWSDSAFAWVKTSNLPDKCQMTRINLQAWNYDKIVKGSKLAGVILEG